jgi:class 3 adenylate cyclase
MGRRSRSTDVSCARPLPRTGGWRSTRKAMRSSWRFAKASNALAAAVASHAALAGGPIRVRMGVHTGEPLVTEEGYVGIDVHRAARIAAAGHGGQILVSQATCDLVGADGLRDLGEHRLNDLMAPERIYQLGDDAFPPLKTLNATNLPVAANPLCRSRVRDRCGHGTPQ